LEDDVVGADDAVSVDCDFFGSAARVLDDADRFAMGDGEGVAFHADVAEVSESGDAAEGEIEIGVGYEEDGWYGPNGYGSALWIVGGPIFEVCEDASGGGGGDVGQDVVVGEEDIWGDEKACAACAVFAFDFDDGASDEIAASEEIEFEEV
jgi:hypothetical protein